MDQYLLDSVIVDSLLDKRVDIDIDGIEYDNNLKETIEFNRNQHSLYMKQIKKTINMPKEKKVIEDDIYTILSKDRLMNTEYRDNKRYIKYVANNIKSIFDDDRLDSDDLFEKAFLNLDKLLNKEYNVKYDWYEILLSIYNI